MAIKLIKTERPGAPPAPPAAAAEGMAVWYIEVRPGRPGLGAVRRHLAEQGIRRIEAVTDRVVRCWAERAPHLPVEWGAVVAQEETAESQPASAGPLPPAPGALVRLTSGPAAGWVGRVHAVERGQVAVEILVWGRGMTVRVPATETVRIGTLPWERSDADGR